jgi:hypothetical protein
MLRELYLWNSLSRFVDFSGGGVYLVLVINGGGYHSGTRFRSLSERQVFAQS